MRNTSQSIFHELPEYAELICINDGDDGSTMGILQLRKPTGEPQLKRLELLLSEYHCADEAKCTGFDWSASSMMGRLDYVTIEEDTEHHREAYLQIAHLY